MRRIREGTQVARKFFRQVDAQAVQELWGIQGNYTDFINTAGEGQRLTERLPRAGTAVHVPARGGRPVLELPERKRWDLCGVARHGGQRCGVRELARHLPAHKQRGGMKQNADDATNERPVVDALGQAGGACRVERGGQCVLVEIRERIAGRAPSKQALIFVGERNRVRARFAAFFFNPDECAHRVELEA